MLSTTIADREGAEPTLPAPIGQGRARCVLWTTIAVPEIARGGSLATKCSNRLESTNRKLLQREFSIRVGSLTLQYVRIVCFP